MYWIVSCIMGFIYIDRFINRIVFHNKLMDENVIKTQEWKVFYAISMILLIPANLDIYELPYVILYIILSGICIEDILYKTISNINIIGILIINMVIVIQGNLPVGYHVASLIFPSSLLLLLGVTTKYKIGMGDIKLLAVLGFGCGIMISIRLLSYACILGGIVSLILLCLRVVKLKDTIPFGPFIIMGYFFAIL